MNRIYPEEPLKLILIQSSRTQETLLAVFPKDLYFGPLLFLLYVNDMLQDVKCDLFLYADDTCLTFQHENVKGIEDQLNLNFSSLCDWFIDNKLSIHLRFSKTKPNFFGTNLNVKWAEPLNIVYDNVKIKLYTSYLPRLHS